MDYAKEIEKFEKSSLFKNYYQRFVDFLKMSGHPYKSILLETAFQLKGSEIRKLAQHARRRGVLICSGTYGYVYARTKKQAESTVRHLKQRVASMQSTIDAMEGSTAYKRLAKGK